jgi:hypothetical protein
MFDMANDSALFKRRAELVEDGWALDGNMFRRDEESYLPLYEGKMFHQFDHRFATYVDDNDTRVLSDEEKADPKCAALPRYWVPSTQVTTTSAVVWRRVARSNDERSIVASRLPGVGVGDSGFIASVASPVHATLLESIFCSFAFDFVARQKLGGVNANFFVFEQLPLPTPAILGAQARWDVNSRATEWLLPRGVELSCTSVYMPSMVASGSVFRWDPARRELIRSELDAALFHLYEIKRDDVAYVMETFPIVKRHDQAVYDEYRTKRLILEAFDAMSAAAATGVPYKTILDPPPAHPSLSLGVAHA